MKVVECFERYMDHGGTHVSRAQFEANLSAKLSAPTWCITFEFEGGHAYRVDFEQYH